MNTILLPKDNNDDAKFTLSDEDVQSLKDKLDNMDYLQEVKGVYLKITKWLYRDNAKSLTEGKLYFSGNSYFAIKNLLES